MYVMDRVNISNVTGTWTQVPVGTWSGIDASAFIGATHSNQQGASYLGPILDGDMGTCSGNGVFCTHFKSGSWWIVGGFQPKRLLNIYDGPFHADNCLCLDVPAMTCTFGNSENPQECSVYFPGPEGDVKQTAVSIYSMGNHPCLNENGIRVNTDTKQDWATVCGSGTPQIEVPNACIGWKQPNGFYYPRNICSV